MKTGAKRLAAILMAAVMMTAMAVPAFAADDSTTPADPKKNDNGITTMEFDKILDADKDTYHPAETFNFTIAAVGADDLPARGGRADDRDGGMHDDAQLEYAGAGHRHGFLRHDAGVGRSGGKESP